MNSINRGHVCLELKETLKDKILRSEMIFIGKIEWFAEGLHRPENTRSQGVVGGVKVGTVLKGPGHLRGKRLVVGGFGRDDFCTSRGRVHDTRIFLTVLDKSRRVQLDASLIKVKHLEEVAAILAAGE